MRAWSSDPLGFGPSGPEGETLVLQGLAPARKSRLPCARPSARANAFERVRPPVVDRPCAWRRRTGLRPLRGGLALSSSVRFRRARPGQESGLCAGSMWLRPDVGLVLTRKVERFEAEVGRGLLLPARCLCRMSPLGRQRFDRGSEPQKSQLLREFALLVRACSVSSELAFGLAPQGVGEARPACRARTERARFQ